MKAIILAAGEGRRLHPLTLDRPKAMLEVGGVTLVERALKSLRRAGFEDKEIIILSGHKAGLLKKAAPGCQFIHNEIYDSTNNIYSLWLARDKLAGKEFLLLNSDVLFASQLASGIISDTSGSVLMVDDVNPLVEEEMRVITDEAGRITAIAKTLDTDESAGEYIGLAKFGEDFSRALFKRIEIMITDGNTDVWYENAIDGILDRNSLFSLSTRGLPWIEIDTHDDLARAEKIAVEIKALEG